CRSSGPATRSSSRAPPITSETGTCPSRWAPGGWPTSTIMCSTRWSRSWASRSKRTSLRSSRRRAATATALEAWRSSIMDIDRAEWRRATTDAVAASGVALTRLLQIVSPALPIGAFAYSQGLEQAVASGWVTDEASAAEWLLGLLAHALTTLDLPVLERLIDAWRADDLARVDAWSVWLAACRPTRETRAEERQLGAALSRALAAIGVREAEGWESREDVTQAAMFAL